MYKYTKNPFPAAATAIISASLTPAIEKGKSMNEQEFNEGINVLSNEDISTYLEKNANEEDISFITPNLKEDDLPNKDAYFLDEKTLENYLGSTEVKKYGASLKKEEYSTTYIEKILEIDGRVFVSYGTR